MRLKPPVGGGALTLDGLHQTNGRSDLHRGSVYASSRSKLSTHLEA
jgi:hypothetical protein